MDRIFSNIKFLDDKTVELNKSFKRKLYWNLWEKNKDRYSTYADFKANWDTNTDIVREIRKGTSSNFKSKIKDSLGLNNERNSHMSRSVTREAQNLLNQSRGHRRTRR